MSFERKTLRNIFGSVIQDNKWPIRTTIELENLYKDVNIVTLNFSAVGGWDIYEYNGWMTQETPVTDGQCVMECTMKAAEVLRLDKRPSF
jgi:hypothetical protein